MESRREALLSGAALGFLGVCLGAFGAHALDERLVMMGRAATWETAVLYHLIHAVALVALGAISDLATQWIARCWVLGVMIFSGSLYVLSVTGITLLGAITPIGGLFFLVGWGLLFMRARTLGR